MQLTLPRALRLASAKAAARWKLSLSTLVESLVIIGADNESETLVLHP